MKLLIVMVTYNRLEFTKRTLNSLLETIQLPHYLVVVDNASTDGTREWLKQQDIDVIYNPKNDYPGRACNIGWEHGLQHFEATHLMRTDNDIIYEPHWDIRAKVYFDRISNLGQLGLEYKLSQQAPPGAFQWKSHHGFTFQSKNTVSVKGLKLVVYPGNTSGTCIVNREIWERGIKFDETPWHDDGGDGPTPAEDAYFSSDIMEAGYSFGTAGEKLAETIGAEDSFTTYPEYYQKTLSERGYLRRLPDLEKYFKKGQL